MPANSSRIRSIDLLKWIALLTMVIDHVSYLAPSLEGLLIVGRISFPLFAVVMAYHVHREKKEAFDSKDLRYLKLLLLFAFVSQPFYMLYFQRMEGNIFLTLLLGLVLAYGYRYASQLMVFLSLSVSIILYDFISYGLAGVLLPLACVWAMDRSNRAAWIVPGLLAAFANIANWKVGLALIFLPSEELEALLVIYAQIFVAATACVFGIWLTKQSIKFSVPKVTKWAYYFYPGHLALLQIIRIVG